MRKARVETKPRKTRLTCENAHFTRDRAWLEARYFGDNLSLAKIAKLIPCSTRAIHRCFVRLKIPFKPKHITYGEINRPDYRGDKNPHWQPNKAKCSDCNEILKNSQAIRCHSCHVAFNRGENHPSWKLPKQRVGTETEIIRNSGEYKEWRIKVWSRDKAKCIVCGIRKDPMIAHHLDGFNIFPEKRFDVDNGVTLCDYHHISFHTNYGFGNNTKAQFDEFLLNLKEGEPCGS